MSWVTDHPQGVVLQIRVIPRAAKNTVQGLHGDALKVRLNAPPVDGAANAALIEFLSDALGIPRSRFQLLAGATSRHKRILAQGIAADSARRLLPKDAAT